MNKKRAFISFDYDNDSVIKTFLVGQSQNDGSPFVFKDNSIKTHLSGDWEKKAESRLDNVDVVIVLCGTKTHLAKGVAIELSLAKKKHIPYFLLKAYSDKHCTKPSTASSDDTMYDWTWPNLKLLIAGHR